MAKKEETIIVDSDPKKRIIRRPNGRLRVQSDTIGESRAQQQFKDECDVNKIIAKYRATGSITHRNNMAQGAYADLTEAPDLQEAMNTVIHAEKLFSELPAQVRNRFNHDPRNMIDFLSKKENEEESYKLGLRVKPKPPEKSPELQAMETIAENTKPAKTPKKED